MTTDPDDTLEILADPETLDRIRNAMDEAAAGDVLSEAELRSALRSRASRGRRPVLDSGRGVPTNVPRNVPTRRQRRVHFVPQRGHTRAINRP